MTVFLAEVGDVCGGGLEDAQAEQAEHRHQREVSGIRRLPCGGEQGLELQMGQAVRVGESAGTVTELDLWFTGLGKVRLEFRGNADIRQLGL